MAYVDFWGRIPDDCKKAISELNRLKVNRLMGYDHERTFTDVWWLALHEVDMYVEGECCMEASRSYWGEGDPGAMNLAQARNADKWLVKWWHLAHKYSLPNEYLKAGGSLDAWGEDGLNYYGGQLI